MKNNSAGLDKKNILVVFTYSNTGFGHLRVSDALCHSIPEDINYLYFQADSRIINFLHKFTSIHPVARSIFEWSQNGIQEDIFTYFYRFLLRKSSHKLINEFVSVIKHVKTPVKKIIVIATHFSIAHQLTFIKDKLEKNLKCKLYIFVQVTDDSPQHIWYVPKTDVIFVPSKLTKDILTKYGKKANLNKSVIKVIPYPVSRKLLKKLSQAEFQERIDQYKHIKNKEVNILIPMSGAAVGMKYFEKFALKMLKNNNFRINFIMKDSNSSKGYIEKLKKIKGVFINSNKINTKVVENYESEIQNKIYGFEITKPSEQAFKSLILPNQIGGMILLFTKAIGRQEYDNLFFLKRHSLIPLDEMQKYLWSLAKKNISLPSTKRHKLFKLAKNWRGIRLPNSAKDSVNFLMWCINNRIFVHMGKYKKPNPKKNKTDEISSDGVKEFWRSVILSLKD